MYFVFMYENGTMKSVETALSRWGRGGMREQDRGGESNIN
jgi:hypothetical protein